MAALNILLVVRWPVGGIRTYLKYVYGCLDINKYRVSILTCRTEETEFLREDLKDKTIDFVDLPSESSPQTWVGAIYRQARSESIDVIHSHGFSAGLTAIVAAKVLRIPHLCTIHETLHAKQFSGIRGLVHLMMLKLFLPWIGVLQTVGWDATANLIEYIPRLGRTPGRVVTIRNGIKSELFRDASSRDLRRAFDLAQDTYLIGFFGRFMSPKGFRYLVDAMELLGRSPGRTLIPIVMAFGEGGFIREEKASIAARGLTRFFRFAPFETNVAPSLKGVDVVAIPSLWEACPLLPMEAMAGGVPVIGSDCIGLREILEDTPATVVPAANALALATALEAHMESSIYRVRAEAFAPMARERFDCRVTARSLERVLGDLVAPVRS